MHKNHSDPVSEAYKQRASSLLRWFTVIRRNLIGLSRQLMYYLTLSVIFHKKMPIKIGSNMFGQLVDLAKNFNRPN